MRVRSLTSDECRTLSALADPELTLKDVRFSVFDNTPSASTVETYAKRAYRKLGASSRWQAVKRHRRLHAELCRS